MGDLFVWLDSKFDAEKKIQILEYKDGFMISPECVVVQKPTVGVYEVQSVREGFFFKKKNLFVDDYVDISTEKINDLMSEIDLFTNTESLFIEYGALYKRGILLHGDPGTGKTSLLNQIMSHLIKKNYMVFLLDDINTFTISIQGIAELKNVYKSQPIAIVVEDIDRFIGNSAELELLQLLDGADTFEPMLFFATTNYINNLTSTFLRPSRIDLIIHVEPLTEEQRRLFLVNKNVPENFIDHWAKETNGFTVAMLKELMLSVLVLNKDLKKVIQHIKERESLGKDPKKSKKLGF